MFTQTIKLTFGEPVWKDTSHFCTIRPWAHLRLITAASNYRQGKSIRKKYQVQSRYKEIPLYLIWKSARNFVYIFPMIKSYNRMHWKEMMWYISWNSLFPCILLGNFSVKWVSKWIIKKINSFMSYKLAIDKNFREYEKAFWNLF